ncbi:response regulator transcription factor [Marinobacter sp. F3R11]|uniref:response regulator transcription factor n=1 Tax=Marinobacter sp. F3R11 TaxID=2267231 RepID=UPI000DEB1CE7|nr:response regulator [Marinobacter sp. F3R11]RBW48064.1 DNA-binding response regulator [Marinobacter sp. F3R11]
MNQQQTVFIVDDDEGIREGLALLLATVDLQFELYESAVEFLDAYTESKSGCLLLDIRMPRMTGLDLQVKLNELGSRIPIIFITGHGDIPMAVEAMRRGALDFIRKPFREQDLLDRINDALEFEAGRRERKNTHQHAIDRIAALTEREREVFFRVAEGDMNKAIGFDLGISERTVEVHRSQVMKKLGVRTLAQLVRVKIESETIRDFPG